MKILKKFSKVVINIKRIEYINYIKNFFRRMAMLLRKCIIEIENISVEDLQKLDDFLKTIKAIKINLHSDEINDNINNSINTDNTDNEHLKRLKKLKDNLTTKQSEVFKFFMNHPGPVYGDVLKKALPMLQPQGALPGVFKATRHWIRLGGDQKNSPFVQIEWSRDRGCGIYRGLTSDEIEYLKTL